ncbi:MAG TPA: ATP-binding protein [Gemmatimonadales bacterium]|nr:ATP-binding protein [Gemmatimonadales bacterium]
MRLGAVRRGSSRRLDGAYPTEVQPLVDELNGLLDHNEQAIKRAATQAASLAHALKTPLAVLANEASRLAKVCNDPAAVQAVDHQARVLREHIDTHLARAGATASGQGLGARCDVGETVDGLIRAMQRIRPALDGGIEARVAPVAFRGERRDLEEILGNLLDNACKWARGHVVLECRRQDACLTFTIDDDGPGLDAPAREAAFRRVARLQPAGPGTGFGLVIVRDLVETYGGTVELADSPLGGPG